MKNIKKIAAMILAFVMCVGFAFAADIYDVVLTSVKSQKRTATIAEIQKLGFTTREATAIFNNLDVGRTDAQVIARSVPLATANSIANKFKAAAIGATTRLDKIVPIANTSASTTNSSSSTTNSSSSTNGKLYNVYLTKVNKQNKTATVNALRKCGISATESANTWNSLIKDKAVLIGFKVTKGKVSLYQSYLNPVGATLYTEDYKN